MTEIMIIEDSFLLPEKGVVVSGVNPSLDSESAERIKSFIGRRVRVAPSGEGGAVLQVKDIGVGESLTGRKSISILLDTCELNMLTRGSRVFTA